MDDTADDKQAGSSLESSVLQQSKEILRESKPSEDISINSNPKNLIVEKHEIITTKPEVIIPKGPANTETVFEKLDINDKSNSSSDSAVTDEVDNYNKSKTPENIVSDVKERSSARNKSDIFSLDNKITTADTIFSVNGTPSGKINRRREEYSEVFPAGCMGCKESSKDDSVIKIPQTPLGSKAIVSNVKESKSRPVSGRFGRQRNPVTGTGVDSTDEIKKNSSGRRRGNF